jgi:hypothetical protein
VLPAGAGATAGAAERSFSSKRAMVCGDCVLRATSV